MIEEKEMVMVSPTGGDPFHKTAYFLKPILPADSPTHESHFNLPHCSPCFDPKKLELRFYGWCFNHQDLQSWFIHLASKHQSTWKKAGVYEAIMSSMCKIKREKDLVCGLAERWCSETNTFIFPWGEATFTLEDVMVLGGFSVLGDSILTPIQSRELKEIQDKLEAERMGLYNKKAGVCFVDTFMWLKKFMKSGDELEHEAFLVFWLSRYVFHNTLNAVNKSVFWIAIRLARGIRVALAPAVLAHIYNELSMLKTTIVSSNESTIKITIKSQFHLLQIWAWERFVELRPKPRAIFCGEPRVALWDGVDCLNVGNMRRVLDSAGEGFMWRPYATAIIRNWNFPKYYVEKEEEWSLVGAGLDEEVMSFATCLRVADLAGFNTVQQYLPHRVARQFGFDQDLPCSVSRHSHNYENAKLYIPSRLSEADVSIRYLNWWKESTSGLSHRRMPAKKKVENAVALIYDATIPCFCSLKNSEESVQVSAARNEGEYSDVPPGFPLKSNRMEAGDPMDNDDLTISEAMKLGKKLKAAETRKSTGSVKLSSPDQIIASSSVDESSMNIMEKDVVLSRELVKLECTSSSSKLECASISPSLAEEGTSVNTSKSARLEKDVPLIRDLFWGGKGKRKMKNVRRSKARSSSLFEKREDGTCSTPFETRISELKAKVYRLEKVVQVWKGNSSGRSPLIES